MSNTFADPWLARRQQPSETWYGVSRSMPHISTLRRLVSANASRTRTVVGVGVFLGPITQREHATTWRHHGLRHTSDQYWWCVSEQHGGFGVGTRLWSHARVLEIVSGFTTPRSRTALVRVHGSPT